MKRRKVIAVRLLKLASSVLLIDAIILLLAIPIVWSEFPMHVVVWQVSVLTTLASAGLLLAATRPQPPKPQIGPRMFPTAKTRYP